MNLSKKSKNIGLAILALIAVAAISVGITLAAVNSDRSGSEQSAASYDDSELIRQTGSTAKDPDFISIPGYDHLYLTAGSTAQSFSLYNPSANFCYFRISLLCDSETLWSSELLAPGQTVSQETLGKALAAGEYDAVLKYECFADAAGSSALNGSEIGLTLRVQ